MTLRECYTLLEGDYDDVLARLSSEALVKRFVFKFLDDSSYDNLLKSLEAEDYKEAFRAAHTIKGICQNLSFTKLFESSNRLTDVLRAEEKCDVTELIEQVKNDYEQTYSAIKILRDKDA